MRVSEKIFYNIKESDISVKVENVTLYFTKSLNAIKFKDRIDEHIARESYRLSGKSRIKFKADAYFAITLYMHIEKHGFRVHIEGSETECLDVTQIELHGLIQSQDNFKKQSITSMQS